MGRLDVRIRHGGGNGSSTALLVLGGLGVMAIGGGSLATVGRAVGNVVDSLLITAAITVGSVVLLAIVLLFVFRRRIMASFRPSRIEWQQIGPERPVQPKQEVHLHFHGDSPEAIRRAVRAAELAGGGTIVVPAGEFDMREVR